MQPCSSMQNADSIIADMAGFVKIISILNCGMHVIGENL